jgi:hypothetical protein
MGKYTSLARNLEESRPQKRGGNPRVSNTNVKMNTIEQTKHKPSVDPIGYTATPLRPYAVNAVVRCIHNTTPDKCAVCSGYVRWLGSDEARLSRAQRDPEATRREFWHEVRGDGA